MDRSILVLGGTSFLGLHILKDLERRGIRAAASTRREIVDIDINGVDWFRADIREIGVIEALINQVQPDTVVNCISLSSRDQCDQEPQLAWVLNTSFVEHLTMLCERSGILLFHMSTDFVFDEVVGAPYDETVSPLASSDLGNTKMLGEQAVLQSSIGRVVRMSTVWGKPLLEEGKVPFAWRALQQVREGKTVDVFSNVYRTPIIADQAAEAIVDMVLDEIEIPLVHLTEGNYASNYENFLKIQGIDHSLVRAKKVENNLTALKLGLLTKHPEFSRKLDFEKGVSRWLL